MSHSLSMPQPAPFSWRRSSALSATLGFHAAVVLLLLMPPVARQIVPALKPDPIVVDVKKVEPPPLPIPPIEVKKFVKAPPVVRTPPVAPPAPVPVVTEVQTPMSTAAPEVSPGPPVDITPAETAPTPLGYGRSHSVPYPPMAAKRGEHGTVTLRVLIGSDGVPQRIEIEKSSGSQLLDRAARDAVMKWRFTAGTKNGVPYTAWGLVPIEFQLDKQ